MKTVKEWFDYFKVLPDMVFGLEMSGGLRCKLENYMRLGKLKKNNNLLK